MKVKNHKVVIIVRDFIHRIIPIIITVPSPIHAEFCGVGI